MKSSDISIVPISNATMSSLLSREDCRRPEGSIPVIGDVPTEGTQETTVTSGCCDHFDLSKEADRQAYADLSTKLYAGIDCFRLWEERITTGNGIEVYVSYIKLAKVYRSGLVNIDLNDKVK